MTQPFRRTPGWEKERWSTKRCSFCHITMSFRLILFTLPSSLAAERIAELKAAIAARKFSASALVNDPPPRSSSSVSSSLPPNTYPTPINSDPSPLMQFTTRSTGAPHTSRRRPAPSPSPNWDPVDLALAEEGFPSEPDIALDEELIPPSTPPHPFTPPRQNQPLPPVPINEQAALSEFADLPMDEIFSSPIKTPPRPSRNQQSSSQIGQDALGGPGPSSSAARAARVAAVALQPRTIVVEKKYAWTKEVETKLRQVFKLPDFRKHQKEAINETMAGKDGELRSPHKSGHARLTCHSLCSDADWRREESYL